MKSGKVYILFIIISFSLPIFLYVDGYRDDFIRIIDRVSIWETEGRPFASAIAMIVNFGKILFNISPLSQILSIIMMYITSCIIADRYFAKANLVLYAIGGTSLFVTPFFIQNLSYQYDVITMITSIFLCVIAVISNKFHYKLILLTLSLCTYQQSIPVFFILTLLDIITTKKAKHAIINSACGAASILIYKLVVVDLFISHHYAKGISKQISIASEDGIMLLINNIINYMSFYLWHYPLLIKLILVSLFILSSFYLLFFIKNERNSRCFNALSLSVTIFASLGSIILFCSFSNIVFQARSFIWPGALVLALIVISCKFQFYINNTFITSVSLIICLYSFSVMSVYSTAYKSMYSFEKNTLLSISMSGFLKDGTIYTYGVMPRGRIANDAVNKYGFLSSSLLTMISEYRGTYLAKSNNLNIEIKQFNGNDSYFTCDNYVYTWNDTYNIHKISDAYVIDFKKIKTCS